MLSPSTVSSELKCYYLYGDVVLGKTTLRKLPEKVTLQNVSPQFSNNFRDAILSLGNPQNEMLGCFWELLGKEIYRFPLVAGPQQLKGPSDNDSQRTEKIKMERIRLWCDHGHPEPDSWNTTRTGRWGRRGRDGKHLKLLHSLKPTREPDRVSLHLDTNNLDLLSIPARLLKLRNFIWATKESLMISPLPTKILKVKLSGKQLENACQISQLLLSNMVSGGIKASCPEWNVVLDCTLWQGRLAAYWHPFFP